MFDTHLHGGCTISIIKIIHSPFLITIYFIHLQALMLYGKVKLPTKIFTKNGNGVPQTMEFKNVDYYKT